MESIVKLIKKINWDNDVARVASDRETYTDEEGAIKFAAVRTINSLIETCLVLIDRVDELSTMVENNSKPAAKTTKTNKEAEKKDA